MPWATFDCYGTLIDWNRGIGDTLTALWPERDRASLLEVYHQVEPEVQAGSGFPYREVLTRTLTEIASREGLELPAGREQALGASLPDWPPFEEVPAALEDLRSRGWQIGILSNTDPDFLDASLANIGVPVDLRITAAEAGSYKPAHGHWERFREIVSPSDGEHVHVAASLFHDIAPSANLGIPSVWINRLGESSDLPRAGELPDLRGLADELDRVLAQR